MSSTGAPSLKVGMGSLLLQTPVALGGIQPFFETGGGFYREALGGRTDSGFARSERAAASRSRSPAPLRLRVDYRGIKLGAARWRRQRTTYTRG
jgi:hypothetical protein